MSTPRSGLPVGMLRDATCEVARGWGRRESVKAEACIDSRVGSPERLLTAGLAKPFVLQIDDASDRDPTWTLGH